MSGTLYIVATPIGNLQDISARALAVLRDVDMIACEDTRQTRKLLDAYAIDTPLTALHRHNEHAASRNLIDKLSSGAKVALVSDAGTPLVSDPGQWLTSTALDVGLRVIPIPGASSVMAALSVSGLSADRFIFAGFVPSKAGEKVHFLEENTRHPMTTVFFETPHRIRQTLIAMQGMLLPDRKIVIARELTKQFEQIVRLNLSEVLEWFDADSNHGRGEFVLLLEGATPDVEAKDWQEMADDLTHANVSSKDAAALVTKYLGVKKKMVYQYIVEKQHGEQS